MNLGRKAILEHVQGRGGSPAAHLQLMNVFGILVLFANEVQRFLDRVQPRPEHAARRFRQGSLRLEVLHPLAASHAIPKDSRLPTLTFSGRETINRARNDESSTRLARSINQYHSG